MASVAALEPVESDVATPVARAFGREPAMGELTTPERVLALQRTIGNAAVGRLLRAERGALQRACCTSCETGKRCEDEEELRAKPRPPPRQRLGRRRLQRLGDVSKIPLVLSCPVPPTGVPQAVASVMFPNP